MTTDNTNEYNERWVRTSCACCGGPLELGGTELCLACFAAGVPFPSRAADVAQTIIEANAQDYRNACRLIAAAPELLEACRAFVEWYPVSRWMSGTDAFAIAQRAIAKAEGRS